MSESKKKNQSIGLVFFLEAPPGIGPGIEVLQTFALPLGYGALFRTEVLYHAKSLLSMLFAKFFFLLLKGRFVIILCGEL